jgi:nicotinamidase-related amidase
MLATLLICLVLLPLQGVAEAQERVEIDPVLLVMDVQNLWMDMMDEADVSAAPEKINEVIALFRENDCPVIRVYHSDPERGPEVGTEPFEFLDSIAITDEDVRIVKAHASAFTDTDLETVIADMECNAVAVCGLSATGCVLATYFGASDRGLMSFMVKDALLSDNAEHTNVIEEICYCVSIEDLREAFEMEE